METNSEDIIEAVNGIDKKFEERVFIEVSKTDGFVEYLKETLAQDILRYFNAPKEQQDIIRGAYTRTLFLYKKILEQRKKNTEE